MLKFDSSWRYESQGSIPEGVLDEFLELIRKLARGEKRILEHYKLYFASASGTTVSESSTASWADSDLQSYMHQAADNAPMFIEAFYDACEGLRSKHDYPTPDVNFINKVLSKHNVAFRIELPNLVSHGSHVTAPPPDIPPSLDQSARELIQKSISEGQKLVAEGRHRQAVQEVLWLLETVTTAFQGLNIGETSIGGKYFNKIIEEIRKNNQGTALSQVIGWLTNLHGYLSSPAGGGIRHGMHLKEGVATSPGEARLYYSLIVSYISYLLSEYNRIKTSE